MVKVDGGAVDVELALAAGGLSCVCGGVLGPWGWARPPGGGGYWVRSDPSDRSRGFREARRRRARCRACGRTHVLVPADGRAGGLAEAVVVLRMVAEAWAPRVFGFRRIVAELVDRPFSTVRNWIRVLARGSAWWAREQLGVFAPAAGRG